MEMQQEFNVRHTKFDRKRTKETYSNKKLTSSAHKGEQEVESKKSKLRSRLGFSDEVQETDIRKQRKRKELRSNALRVNIRCPWINWKQRHATQKPNRFSLVSVLQS